MTVSARELRLDDLMGVQALRERHGFSIPDERQWSNLHVGNPARAAMPDSALGWVLEDGEIVGCFLNIPLRWWFRGQTIRAAATSGWIVDERCRHSSFQLISRYFAQRDVELFLNWSANPVSSQVFEAYKGRAAPSVGTLSSFTWITHPSAACAAYLDQRVPPSVRAMLTGAARLFDRGPRASRGAATDVRVLDAVDSRFDDFWARLRATSERCLQYRDSATLRWLHAGLPAGGRILALERRGNLVGYALLVRRDHRRTGVSRYQVVDIQAQDEDESVVRELMCGALRQAREEEVAVVEAGGFHPKKRRALRALSPFLRKLPMWPYYFRAKGEMAAALLSVDAWDPCPLEGDGVIGLF